MKLIDLLVQELPKRKWIPAKWEKACAVDGLVALLQNGVWQSYGCICYRGSDEVTREQYEAALAASQKDEWDGVGVPPVGCECEYTKQSLPGDEWTQCTVDYVGASFVVYRDCYGVELTGIIGDIKFRPIRSEADKKRDAALDAMLSVFSSNAATGTAAALKAIYDAIAAGKIPGVKLSD